MQRVVGVHALQKALRHSPKRQPMAQDHGSLLRTWLLPFIAPTSSAQNNTSDPLKTTQDRTKESMCTGVQGGTIESELDAEWAVQPVASEEASPPSRSEAAPGHFGGSAGVGVLRERGAVLLLYSLSKLYQVGRGWETAVTHPDMQGVVEALLDHLSRMTLQLDAQVGGTRVVGRLLICLACLMPGPSSARFPYRVQSSARASGGCCGQLNCA